MPLNIPQSVLSRPQAQRANVVDTMLGGRQAGAETQQLDREQRIRELKAQIAQESNQPGFDPLFSQAVQELSALDPTSGGNTANAFLGLSKARKQAQFSDIRKVNKLLKAGQPDQALAVINNRLEQGEKLGQETGEHFDPSGTMEIRDDVMSGRIPAAIEKLSRFEEIEKPFMDSQDKTSLTSNERDEERYQELLIKARETGDPNDIKRADQFGRKAGFLRSTEQEKADIKVTAAEKKEVNKHSVKRKQGFINSGIEAADSTAVLRRSIDLLDDIKTGGFDNVLLNAKKFLGVEGADEGELSANMGKAVLKQLKPIFGAAFTVNEKDELLKLEAGFGKSAANNKRLLKRALKIADRAARRGIAAAESLSVPDTFTADEIRASLNFELKEKPKEEPQQSQLTSSPVGELSDDDILKMLNN